MRAALHADSIADFSPLYKGIRKHSRAAAQKRNPPQPGMGCGNSKPGLYPKHGGARSGVKAAGTLRGGCPAGVPPGTQCAPVSRSPASLFLRVPSGRQFLSFPNEKATAASKGTVYLPSAPSASFDDPCGNTVFFHGCLSISPDITKAGEALLPRPVFLLPRFSVFPDTRSVHRTWHPDRCRERHRPLPTFQNG